MIWQCRKLEAAQIRWQFLSHSNTEKKQQKMSLATVNVGVFLIYYDLNSVRFSKHTRSVWINSCCYLCSIIYESLAHYRICYLFCRVCDEVVALESDFFPLNSCILTCFKKHQYRTDTLFFSTLQSKSNWSKTMPNCDKMKWPELIGKFWIYNECDVFTFIRSTKLIQKAPHQM